MSVQEVILVNEADESIGFMEKMEAHEKALLHRAFSVFIFDEQGRMLLQQRADSKYHSAGLWSNACCSHPQPNEDIQDAANRRLKEELGFQVPLTKAFSFTYKAAFENGLTEHEFDHVFVGTYNGEIIPNSDEVKAYGYKSFKEIEDLLAIDKDMFTPWFLIAYPVIKNWVNSSHKKF